jgi:hypothetical protein
MIWYIDVMAAVAKRPAPVILIVESDRDLRMVTVHFIKEEGFETLEAGDADQAIRAEAMIAELHLLVGRAAPPMQAQGRGENPGNEPF